MGKKIITLYIDDTSIRLLVTDGKRIKKWADLPLEPGLIEGTVVLKEAEVASKIKQLLREQKVKAKKVIVGVSGLHCLTRPITLPLLPKTLLEEAVTRESERLLPLALDQLYIMWRTIPAPQGKTRVFLAAVRRRTADALLKMLGQAGLKPYLMDAKPLALARVVKEITAVLVDVQPTDFDIVIMADGIPQPIRTVAFSPEASSWQEKYSLIRNELDRTIQFYNSNNQEKPLAPSTTIFVSGELALQPDLSLSLSRELGYPVSPLSPPLECPEQLDLSRYMVNIGLALKEPSLVKRIGPSVANLNLLPTPYQPKPISWGKVISVPAAIGLLALFFMMMTQVQGASTDITLLHSQLDIANNSLVQKQLQNQETRNNIAELEKKLAEAKVSYDNFAAVLSSLDRKGNEFNSNLEAATNTNTVPSTAELVSISYAGSLLTINGDAPGEEEVLSYAKSLNDSGRFAEIIIANMKKNENEGIDFTLVLKVRG